MQGRSGRLGKFRRAIATAAARENFLRYRKSCHAHLIKSGSTNSARHRPQTGLRLTAWQYSHSTSRQLLFIGPFTSEIWRAFAPCARHYLRRRTPGPPPFSSMKSTPALSKASRTALSFAAVSEVEPLANSALLTVASPNSLALARSSADQRNSARAEPGRPDPP